MDITKCSILDFLSEHNIIAICAWQRDFAWDNYKVEKFYDDVMELMQKQGNCNHFFGTIIYKGYQEQLANIELIDGKQRIIVVSLLICALCNYFEADKYKQILLLPKTPKRAKTKLKFYNNNISEIYENTIFNVDYAYFNSSVYAKIYRYFSERIENDKLQLEDYFNSLKRFQIIEVELNDNDDCLAIHNNINGIYTPLNIFDKIKTFVLFDMDKNTQGNMVTKYWEALKQLFVTSQDLFIHYLISYLSMHTDNEIQERNVLSEFYKFYNLKLQYKKSEKILPELHKFAQYYLRIINSDFTQEISIQFERILKCSDNPKLFSFLFEITDDFQNALIPQRVFIDILKETADNLEFAVANNQKIEFKGLSKSISRLLAQKYE